jgi:hypothetical protein
MTPDDPNDVKIKLSRKTSIASDIAGYVLAGAITFVMFALSGSFN